MRQEFAINPEIIKTEEAARLAKHNEEYKETLLNDLRFTTLAAGASIISSTVATFTQDPAITLLVGSLGIAATTVAGMADIVRYDPEKKRRQEHIEEMRRKAKKPKKY